MSAAIIFRSSQDEAASIGGFTPETVRLLPVRQQPSVGLRNPLSRKSPDGGFTLGTATIPRTRRVHRGVGENPAACVNFTEGSQ